MFTFVSAALRFYLSLYKIVESPLFYWSLGVVGVLLDIAFLKLIFYNT